MQTPCRWALESQEEKYTMKGRRKWGEDKNQGKCERQLLLQRRTWGHGRTEG